MLQEVERGVENNEKVGFQIVTQFVDLSGSREQSGGHELPRTL